MGIQLTSTFPLAPALHNGKRCSGTTIGGGNVTGTACLKVQSAIQCFLDVNLSSVRAPDGFDCCLANGNGQ